MPKVAPVRARVRMYQVGFGDCFLLTFEYAKKLSDGRDRRHILIDFGTKKLPWKNFKMKAVADLIRKHVDELDVLVVTHRHEDHLSALGQKEPAAIIGALRPKLVVRSWTEHPKAKPGATGPVKAASRRFAAQVGEAQSLISQLAEDIQRRNAAVVRDERSRELVTLAAAQLTNKDAIKQLEKWAAGGKKGEYLHAGAKTRIERLVPGVRVHVLGPPTVEQHPAVRSEADKHPEFWMASRATLRAAIASLASGDGAGQPGRRRQALPQGSARTVAERLGRQRVEMLLSIVRILDDMLNNTSLILLFEAGRKRLLFAGDAQIENWEYALGRKPDEKLLRAVDLYKVGHHGSRNATPQTLYRWWQQEGRPMVAMMSTKPDFYGDEAEHSEVPRKSLADALKDLTQGRLYRTDELDRPSLYIEVEGDLKSNQPFRQVPVT